jgi:hypothetical protein
MYLYWFWYVGYKISQHCQSVRRFYNLLSTALRNEGPQQMFRSWLTKSRRKRLIGLVTIFWLTCILLTGQMDLTNMITSILLSYIAGILLE